MIDVSKISTIGYHGTTKQNALSIINEKHFKDSKRDNEWLGTGVYFFKYKAHAVRWTTHNRYSGRETSILKVELEYTSEQMLDLDDPEELKALNRLIRNWVLQTKNAEVYKCGINMKEMSKYKRLCLACNLYKQICPENGIIKYTFPTHVTDEYSGFTENQQQLCVSDHSIISKICMSV